MVMKSNSIVSLLGCFAVPGVALITFIAAPPSTMAATDPNEPPHGFHAFIGYRQVDVGEYHFVHDTHPDDSFLPAANKPGSAGTTKLGTLHFISFGAGYDRTVGRHWSVNLDVGGLGGPNRDEHQNDNDYRDPAMGAFVFSKANWGIFAAVGVNYHIQRLYLGAEAQVGGVWLQSGWDRYNEDETEHVEFRSFASGGPKIGVRLSEAISLEATAQFGRSARFGLSLKRTF